MGVLMSLQGSQMETDDPTTSYMLQVSHLSLEAADSDTIKICVAIIILI